MKIYQLNIIKKIKKDYKKKACERHQNPSKEEKVPLMKNIGMF